MALYTNQPPARQTPAPPPQLLMPDPAHNDLAGLFGAMSADFMEEVHDFNTARVGIMRVTYAVPNIPDTTWPWGMVLTCSSRGAGKDGRRQIGQAVQPDELIYQIFITTKAALYTRCASGSSGWCEWHKRWEAIG